MIKNIIQKEEKIIKKSNCLEQIEELRRKRLIVISLIKEYASRVEVETWDLNPTSILCEVYVYVTKLYEYLNNMRLKFKDDKRQIRLTSEEILVYESYFNGLDTFSYELRHLYGINLIPEENIS